MTADDALVLMEMRSLCGTVSERIARFSMDGEAFLADDALQDLLLMPVFQMGELVNALSDGFADEHPEVPCHQMRGLRNVIAHDYGSVRPRLVWETATRDVPALAKAIDALLGN